MSQEKSETDRKEDFDFRKPLTENEKLELELEQERTLQNKYGNPVLNRQKSKSNVRGQQYFDSADYSMARAKHMELPRFPPAHIARSIISESQPPQEETKKKE